MEMKSNEESRKRAIVNSLLIAMFPVAGVASTLFFPFPGLSILGPLLLGPGIAILLFGALFEHTLGPLMGLKGEFPQKIKVAYVLLGGLFSLMGLFLWMFG